MLTDFCATYGSVDALGGRRKWLVHLLGELKNVDQRNDSPAWRGFAKKLRRVVGDGVRLRGRSDLAPERYQSRIEQLKVRPHALSHVDYRDADAVRLAKRLRRYSEYIFTFLDHPEVAWENNFAERMVRPAVIPRKNSHRTGVSAAPPRGPS